MLVAACDGDDPPTAPAVELDRTAPEITITAAPDAGLATHDVTLEWSATDDVSLASVSISWGVPASREEIDASGHSDSGSFTYTYESLGTFRVFLAARDDAGNTATAEHEIVIGRPAPSPPERLIVTTEGNTATISWDPGAWATDYEVTVSRLDGSEPDRVLPRDAVRPREVRVPDLSWEESYEARVAALNSLGQAETDPVAFAVLAPVPPFLDRFSAAADSAFCLEVAWSLGPDVAESYEVVVTGGSAAESFSSQRPLGEWYSWTPVAGFSLKGQFCSPEYPVVDGMTYTAQVFAVFGDRSFGSQPRNWTVDFDPIYSATGTWVGVYTHRVFDLEPRGWWTGRYTLELVEVEGSITGTWAWSSSSGQTSGPGPVTGSRDSTTVELTLELDGSWNTSIAGSFAGGDGLVATAFSGLLPLDVFFQRQ
jgi:hypothetical protein